MVGLAAGRFPARALSGFRARHGSRLREATASALRGLRVPDQRRSGIARSANLNALFIQPRHFEADRALLYAGNTRRHIGHAPGNIRSPGVPLAKPPRSRRRTEASRLLARSLSRRSAFLLLLFRGPEFAHALGPA